MNDYEEIMDKFETHVTNHVQMTLDFTKDEDEFGNEYYIDSVTAAYFF